MNLPLVIANTKDDEFEFLDDESYERWAKTAPKHTLQRFKGLGTFNTKRFKKILDNKEKYLVKVNKLETVDFDSIALAFKGSLADERKEWLNGVNYFNEFE